MGHECAGLKARQLFPILEVEIRERLVLVG